MADSKDDRPELPREYPAAESSPGATDANPNKADERRGAASLPLPDPATASLVTDSVITRPLAERMAGASPTDRIGVVIERTDTGTGRRRRGTVRQHRWRGAKPRQRRDLLHDEGTRGRDRQKRDRAGYSTLHNTEAPEAPASGRAFLRGRAVTAAVLAANSPVSSLSLLQAAYSHYGMAKGWDGASANGLFMEAPQHVSGPVIVTFTKNDKAVGMAYPIASRLAKQIGAGLGDQNDPYGGIGRNGALNTPATSSRHFRKWGTHTTLRAIRSGRSTPTRSSPATPTSPDDRSPRRISAVVAGS